MPTLDFTSAAATTVILRHHVFLTVVGAVSGIVVVEGLQAVFVGGQQVFEHQLHGDLGTVKLGRVVVGIAGDCLVDKLLHDTHQLQVTVVGRDIPQQFIVVFQSLVFRHYLLQDTVFGRLDADVTTRWLNAVGGIGDLRRRL